MASIDPIKAISQWVDPGKISLSTKNTKSTKWGKQAFRRKAKARKIFKEMPSYRSPPNGE